MTRHTANLRSRLLVLLSDPVAAHRGEALEALADVRMPLVAELLRLILTWEENPEVKALGQKTMASIESDLTASGKPPTSDRIARAFRSAGSRYYPLGLVGSDPMGPSYLAVQLALKRLVTLKAMVPRAGGVQEGVGSLVTAIEAVSRIEHPNVASVVDSGVHETVRFLVTELVDGQPLVHALSCDEANDWELVVDCMIQAASGLQAMHDLGVTHGPFSAASFVLDRFGTVKLTDFGQLRFRTPSGSVSPRPESGSTGYGESLLDVGEDLRALGTMLYRALSGRPYDKPSGTDADNARLPAMPGVPAKLEGVFARLFMEEPSRSFGSCEELITSLKSVSQESFSSGLAVAAEPATAAGSLPTPAPTQWNPPVEQLTDTVSTSGGGAGNGPMRSPQTILVVDDEATILDLIGDLLSDAGYRVLGATNPEQALATMSEGPVDLVLTDILFPGGCSGLDLVEKLQMRYPDAPIVAMSGSRDVSLRESLIRSGVLTFLSKPLSMDQVLAVAARACQGGCRSLLIVDDDRLLLTVLKRLFEKERYRVRVAEKVCDALSSISEETPDVIVCDLRLKDESGLDLLRESSERYPDVPFIMLTASPSLESVSQAYRMRVFDFVTKSSDSLQLRRSVRAAVWHRMKWTTPSM